MNEKDLWNRIKESAEDVEVPAALQPDAIEKMLLEQKNAAESEKSPKTRPEAAPYGKTSAKKKRNLWKYAARYGSIAAIFALTFTAVQQSEKISELSQQLEVSRDIESILSDQLEQMEASLEEAEAENAAENTELLTENSPVADAMTDAGDTTNAEVSAENAAAESAPRSAQEDILDSMQDIPTSPEDGLNYADSYEEIYEALRENFYYDSEAEYEYEESVIYDMVTEEAGSTRDLALSSSADTGSKDFSETNRQEEGVDEADIVKTDGDYLYILRQDGSFVIVRADGASSEVLSTTQLETSQDFSVKELYLDGDMLNVIVSETGTSLDSQEDMYFTTTSTETVVYTYDISDRSQPLCTGTVRQEGRYSDSRKVGQHVYLFTKYSPVINSTYEDSMIIPRINGTAAEASDFYLPSSLENSTYLVISSVDLASPFEIQDSKILVSGASHFYVSPENIYIANAVYTDDSERTEITKFSYADGSISGVAAGSVKGYLNDSFSMNEHNGYLRVVSTYLGNSALSEAEKAVADLLFDNGWTEHNGLYIFDASMNQVSAIEDLAAGETIRSARFFGDTGYFVTFRQTDPLFSVDLSDPTNPQILGELKISGFSSYLHFYSEDLLLGLGYEADEDTGRTTGIKLSMFDISDPANVTEVHRFVIPGITWCPAIEDYKALLVDPEKNVIGFYCDNRYLTFSYDPEEGFAQDLVYDFYSDMLTGAADYDNMRGLFIEDTLYLAGETFVVSFDMEQGYEKLGILLME